MEKLIAEKNELILLTIAYILQTKHVKYYDFSSTC